MLAPRGLGVVFTIALVAGASATVQAQVPNDAAIAQAVREDLGSDPAVEDSRIDVASHEGVVILAGGVDSLLTKRWIEDRVLAVRGVRSVVNVISVVPGRAKTDTELRADAADALAIDPAVDSSRIGVEVKDGSVILLGRVDSWQEKQLAEQVVAGVGGARAVDNRMEITPPRPRSNGDIRNEIERALRWDAYVDDVSIAVIVHDGHVKLDGKVRRAIERRHALRDAWVAGVRSVDVDGLVVDVEGRDVGRVDGSDASDREVTAAIADALRYDPRARGFRIDVSVNRGIVTLDGVVSNLRARHAAERDARNTFGVAFVNNQIAVQPVAARGDAQIREEVLAAIARSAYVGDSDIQASVRNGTVTLTGSVESYWEKAQAEDAVAGIGGVVAVRNYLRVRRGT